MTQLSPKKPFLLIFGSTKLQEGYVDRLDVLNKRKSAIEEQIIARMKSIELLKSNFSGEMTAMLAGRLIDLKEASLQ